MMLADELMTPGCPQCAYKHLSSALSYLADHCDMKFRDYEILLARAAVNLTEVVAGYRSHFPFAVGLLERAELAVSSTCVAGAASDIRTIRVHLITDGDVAIPGAITGLTDLVSGIGAFMWAHMIEASREFKFSHAVEPSEGSILSALDEIRREYFDQPEEPEKGGEEVMACCKKGKCAAAKGGKANAKLPVKGGKKVAKKGGK